LEPLALKNKECKAREGEAVTLVGAGALKGSSDPALVVRLREHARGLAKRHPATGAKVYVALYRWRRLRSLILWWIERMEGDVMFSPTWRTIAHMYHSVALGEYSYGPGLRPWTFLPGTVIGRYCSIAAGVLALRRNHPVGFPSQHPLFFNAGVGLLDRDTIPAVDSNPLRIGHDVWLGARVIVLPGCREIGDGAVVSAGALVTKDVPPFTIVGGNPARVIRKRFASEVEAAVAASQWWRQPIEEIVEHIDLFTRELTVESLERFRKAFPPRNGRG
jgi:virginiamycin A acetyltransferase